MRLLGQKKVVGRDSGVVKKKDLFDCLSTVIVKEYALRSETAGFLQ